MVIKLVLLDKLNIDDHKRKSVIKRYKKHVLELAKGFQNTKIEFSKIRKFDNRTELIIRGPEEIFISNLFKKEIGSIKDFKDIKINNSLKGGLVDVGNVGFGLFLDCGIFNPKIDVLISLNTLREQLCRGKKRSLPEIIKAYDFIDNFPFFIKVISINQEKNEIKGEIEENSLNFYHKLINENLEAVFISGETKAQLKKALERTGHFRDIVLIIRYGFLENIVILKENTNAPGIISDIGPILKYCKMSAIRPQRINKLFK